MNKYWTTSTTGGDISWSTSSSYGDISVVYMIKK